MLEPARGMDSNHSLRLRRSRRCASEGLLGEGDDVDGAAQESL